MKNSKNVDMKYLERLRRKEETLTAKLEER
jgi:hypothetical protein